MRTQQLGAGAPAVPRGGDFRIEATVEQLVLVAALFWSLAANTRFLSGALHDRSLADMASWGFVAALVAGVFAIHTLLLALVANRWIVKPLLASMIVVTAVTSHYMNAFGVYVDPAMMRNVLRTHPAEASELISGPMLLHLLLYAGLPLLVLWRVRVVTTAWRRATLVRFGLILLAAAVLVGTVLAVFKPLSSLMRNQKELRYLITPANVIWSTGAVMAADLKGAAQPRQAIGLDAKPGTSWSERSKPMVVVLIVGETTRAANWGLTNPARQTTPELAQLPVVNFPRVTDCGTNTEVSLPCMFAPVGRRDYDEARIRGQDSLLHIVSRAGVGVHWRDNQSGCKGVCDGLPTEVVTPASAPGLCPEGRCLDAGLVHDLDKRLASAKGTQLWVLHMLGSHGPAYFKRYPSAFARFQPECRQDDLRQCSQTEIVNAYDNSVLYTDHVVATAVAKLRAARNQVDSALIFVSDHGESLGESGLFLHGIPYAIAPDVQKQVPMVMWVSEGLEKAAGMKSGCLWPQLRQRAAQSLAHDHLFHTLLGLLDVRTALHHPDWDLTEGCNAQSAPKL